MDFVSRHWGDLASLLGLAITIWFAWRAKSAAEQARDAAEEVSTRISSFDSVEDLSSAISTLREILRLQRVDHIAWEVVLDRYSTVQSLLVRVEESGTLGDTDRSAIKAAREQLRIGVRGIETAQATPEQLRLAAVRLNQAVSDQLAILERARVRVKKAGT